MSNPMVRSLYKSADMEEDLTITLQPVDGFQHMRGQSGVVFHAQSNGEVTLQISWHGRRPPHNFATSGWISTYEGAASIFPKPGPSSTVLSEINGLTLQVPKLDAMLNLVVRNCAKLVLLSSGPASMVPNTAWSSSVLNESNRFVLQVPKLDG